MCVLEKFFEMNNSKEKVLFKSDRNVFYFTQLYGIKVIFSLT